MRWRKRHRAAAPSLVEKRAESEKLTMVVARIWVKWPQIRSMCVVMKQAPHRGQANAPGMRKSRAVPS